jgi:hypothetical protein
MMQAAARRPRRRTVGLEPRSLTDRLDADGKTPGRRTCRGSHYHGQISR